MNPYSNDLRQKIVDAYKHNEGSLRVLARRFSVSLSFVRDLVKLERTTGKVMAKPPAGGPARKISGANLLMLRELVERHRDATLRKAFQAEWATRSVDHLHILDETGIHLGMTHTSGRALRGRRVVRDRTCPSRHEYYGGGFMGTVRHDLDDEVAGCPWMA